MWHKPIKDKNNENNILCITYNALCSGQRWSLELKLIVQRLDIVIISIIAQFVHSAAANYAYYKHIPSEPLRDLGFELIPEIHGPIRDISEHITLGIVFSSIFWSFYTFYFNPTPVHWV